VMINQFYWFGEMITVSDDYLRVIFFYGDHDWPAIRKRIYFRTIYYCSYFQEA
jgi:hypothetical protein